jgi:hypothetical protein
MIAPPFTRRPVRARLATLAASLIVTLPMAVAVVAPVALATTTGIDVTLPLGHRIQGLVTDQDGRPVEGAEVFASSIVNVGDARDTTDAGGHYLLHALPDSTYHVHVDPPRGANLLERWYGAPDSNPEEVGAVDVVVEGADVTGIDVQLEAGLRILGTVRDPDGLPVAGVRVGRGISDAEGRYEYGGLRPDTYTLFVSPPDGSDFLSGPLVDGHVGGPEEEGTPVTLEAADVDGIDVELSVGLRISGNVTAARPGPIEVTAAGETFGRATADDAGDFVIRALRPGSYRLFFRRPTGGILTEGGEFPLGEYPVPVELTTEDVVLEPVSFPRGTDIVGNVTDHGVALPNPYLFVCDAHDELGCAAANGAADGSFRVGNVPTGDWRIFVSVPNHVVGYYGPGGFIIDSEAATPVHVVSGGPDVTGIEIKPPAGASFSGRVTGPSGEPIEGARVLPTNIGIAPNWAIPRSHADGTYHVQGIATGLYRISVDAPEGADYLSGYYDAAAPSGYTADYDQATEVRLIEDNDRTAPVVTVRDPAAGATGVDPTVPISIRLSEPVDGVDARSVQLKDMNRGRLVPADVSFDPHTRTATIVPLDPLRPNTKYKVSLANTIRDWSGNRLAVTSWSFRTGSAP